MGDAFLRRGGAVFAALNLVSAPDRTAYIEGERPDLSGIACEAVIGATVLTLGAEALTAWPDRPLRASDTEIYACLDIGGAERFVTIPVSVTAPSATFGDNGWDVIARVCRAGMAKDLWVIGDAKTYTDKNGNAHTARIIGFDHDALHADDPLYGGDYNGAGRLCAMTLALGMWSADTSGAGTGVKMNDAATNADGWRASLMRAKTMAEVAEALPDDLRGALRLTEKRTGAGKKSAALNVTGDRVFLASEAEANDSTANSAAGEGSVYTGNGAFYVEMYRALLAAGLGEQAVRVWMRSPDRRSNDAYVYYRMTGTVISAPGGGRDVQDGTLRQTWGADAANLERRFVPAACV